MNEFTSQYLKRREELSGRQSGFTPAVIPLPTFSNAVTFQQRTKERTPSAPEPERVSLFRNDLLSKVSEKRVPDLSTRLRIRSESDAMRAEDLTRERRDILGFNPAPTQEQRDRVTEIDREREALRQRSEQLREDARWAEYGQLRYRPDFYANSARPRSTLDDTRRRVGGEAVDERYLVGLEHAGGVGSMEWIERARQLTDDELAMYNYLRNTEGQESADAYLDLMEEALNQRVGGKQAEDIANIENPLLRTAATGAYAVGSGLDQFGTGVKQLFTEEALPTTATQFGAAQVREDLADASPSIGGKPLVLPGGASLGQAAFDLVSSAANMAPGLALSAATAGAGAAPWLSGLAASGSLGAAAGGNAYNEAVKQGYTPAQARSYAILTGASEGGLQYLLGGIGALGGRVSRNVIQNTVKNIDNALLRAGAELGLNMLSEGAEEYLQEVLTPVFRNIALDENNPVELVSEEAIYAGILGALSAGVLDGPGRVSGAVSDARTDRSIDRAYSGMMESGIAGFTPGTSSRARSTGQYGTSTSDAWYNRNADVQLLPSRETETAPAPEPEQARWPSPLSKDEAERLNRIFAKTPPETAQDGGLTLPTASGAGAAAPRGDVRELTLPGGDSGVVRMSLDEYLGRQGLSAPISDYMDDKLRLPHGETQRQRARREADANAAADDYAARRQAAIQEYNQKVQAGEITPKSRIERLIETARGHDDNESVQAARRALEKRGIDWRVDEDGGPLYDKGPESSVGAARADFTGDTVRGFSRNLATDRARHHDIREDFELAPEKYFRLSNRETLKKAQDIFSAGLDSARSTVEQAIGAAQAGQKLSPEMVPLSKMVADALAARGDLDGARNILASMAAELTSAGQLGQAARILRDADPQATIDSVEKIVKKLNEELGSGGNGGTSGSTEITEKAYRALKESRDDAVRLIQNIISAFQDQSTEQTDPLSSRYRRTWVEQLGRELANRAAASQTDRTSNSTAYQTILGDLTAFMKSYLSRRNQGNGPKRTAAERLADYFQNREEYAAAWNQAKDRLRARYGKDRQMMDRLEDFLNGTISYSGAGSDAVMLEAVTRAALENDVNMDRMIVRQQYDEDALAGQVADTLIRQTGAEGSDQQIIRDAVLRHIREKTADAGRGSGDIIHRDIQNAMRKLGVRLSQVIEQGARSKEELARNIASVLSGEYGVSESVSQSLSQDIVDDFGRMVEEASRKKLKQIFSKRPKAERRTMEQAFERLVNLGAFYNGEYSGQAAGRVFGARANGIQIDQALIDEFSRQTTDEGRADVLNKIYQNVADQIPSTFMDKFNALRYLNMLGNLKTQVRNVGGNAIMKGVRAQRVKLQAAMENLAEKAARAKGAEFERTVSLTKDREIFKLAKEEFDRSAEALMGERKYSYNGQSIPAAIQNRRTIFKNNGEWGLDGKGPASLLRRGADALMGGLEAYRRTVNNAMEGGDMIFAKGIYADALSRYLKANGVTAEQYRSGQVDEGLLDRARQWAVKEAQEATFRDSNAFSDMIAKIGFRNPKNGIEKAANMAVQGVLPFRRTPANVGVRAVEYSPLGIIDTAVKAAKTARGSESVTSADVIASLSKTLTGTGLFALGVALGMGGMLSGLGSDDENEAELDEQEGGQAYALYLPDWLTGAVGLPEGFNLTLDWASPAAIPLFMGAELGNQAAGNGVQGKDLLTALASSSNVLLNMSMLQGINDQLENISYSENPLVDLTLNSLTDFWTAGLTSTLGGQIERTLEDVRMSTYTDENSELPTDLQYELGSQLARVPGVDYQQIPFVDGWGRTESSGHWLPRAGNQFLNPSYTSSDTSTPYTRETRRLYEATGDGGVVSKRPEKEITVDSQTKYLSAGEYLQYATERGQMREQLVTDIIGRDAYQDMGAAEQAEVIKDVYSYTDAIAKSHISEYEPSSWVKKVETYGVDPSDAILYRAAKRALEDADVEGVTSELRSMLMEDTSLTSGEKAAIDKAILSEKSKVDYSSQESFLISQMSDAAQSKWPGIRDRFGLSAEEYQEAVRIYNMDKDDGVTTADKKRMLREMFGWEGNAIYKALGKKADSDEED